MCLCDGGLIPFYLMIQDKGRSLQRSGVRESSGENPMFWWIQGYLKEQSYRTNLIHLQCLSIVNILTW